MNKKVVLFLLASLSLNACAADLKPASRVDDARSVCEVDNASLRAMPLITVELSREDGTTHRMLAKLASTNATRAAGFQRVCAETIAAMPILFEFEVEQMPGFHMNNVVAPIDIAFIKQGGRIESIQSMQPYSVLQLEKKLWRPKQPVKYALEVAPGFFDKHGLSRDSTMSWKRADSKPRNDLK